MYIGLHVEYSFRFLTKLECSLKIFEKKKNYSCIKFHENPSSGSRGVPRGRLDGRDKANSRFFFPSILRTRVKNHTTATRITPSPFPITPTELFLSNRLFQGILRIP